MDNRNSWIGPIVVALAVLYGCQQRDHAKKLDEAQALARDAYAEAQSAKGQVSDLEIRVTDLEQRLGQ